MNHNDSSVYCVVKFLEFPFKGDYVCIPSSWVRLRRKSGHTVFVSYPDKHSRDTERYVRQRKELSGAWRIYTADVEFSTDSYEEAQNFINEQVDDVHDEYRRPNVNNKGDELLGKMKKKTYESKRKDKLNHKTAVPQEFVIMKNNDESPTKLKLKRVSNVIILGSKEPKESDSEAEFSSSEEPESSNKNQLSPPHSDCSIENSCTEDIPVAKSQNDNRVDKQINDSDSVDETNDLERSTNNTSSDIQNSYHLANQSLDSTTITKDDFFTRFSTFLLDLASFGDINQLSKSFSENPEMTKNVLKTVINRRTPNNNIPTASTSKDTKAEVTKISRKKRNEEKEQIDDNGGNGEDQVLKKKRCFNRDFDLPPEYDKNDTRWTLKYRTSAPGLVELMPHTGVYINSEKLSNCMRLAKDCKALARSVLLEIFKKSALSTCSLTGARAQIDTFGEHVRPGLDENARKVLMAFVKEYGRNKGWETSDTQSILHTIRNKMQGMRPKQK